MFNDLTLKIYTFFKVRDSLVLFIVGLALITTGMHEISLSQSGLNITRGAPRLNGIPERGAPGLDDLPNRGAPDSNNNLSSGAPTANAQLAPTLSAQLAPSLQGVQGPFIQGRLAPFTRALGAERSRNTLGAEPLLQNEFGVLLENEFGVLLGNEFGDLLANEDTPFIDGTPSALINGTPDQFLDSSLAEQSSGVIGAEDLLQNIEAEGLAADGVAEEGVGETLVAENADIPFDDSLIRFSVGNLFRFIEGAFGALLVVGAGIGAIIAATVGAYKMALSLLVTSVGAFILRAYVSLFFGTDYPDFDSSVNLADF